MKLLTLEGVRFTHVAYLDECVLLSADYRGGTCVRRWALDENAPPQEVKWPQARAVLQLFKPNAKQFLQRQALWSELEALPPAFSDDPNELPSVLEPVPYCEAFFHSDGETVAFCETVPGMPYQTRFHLRDSADRLHELLLTFGVFGFSGSFSPDGNLVAMSNGMKLVWVWNVPKLTQACQLTQGDGVSAIAFLTNDQVAVAAGRTVRVWGVSNQRQIHKFPAFRKYVDTIAVSPDRSLFAAGSRDGIVRVWESATGRERGRYDWNIGEVKQVAFAPDGQTAAAAGQKGISIWDLD